MTRLLFDTDAFCKLATWGVFDDVLAGLGGTRETCAVLHELVYALRRGSLTKTYRPDERKRLLDLASVLPIAPDAQDPALLDMLLSVTSVDPGEARLFAAAIETDAIVVSGDKRALRAIASLRPTAQSLEGRLVSLEHALLCACRVIGAEEVNRRVSPRASLDTAVCFCLGLELQAGLASYARNLQQTIGAEMILRDVRVFAEATRDSA